MSRSAVTRTSLAILVVGFLVLFVGGGSRFAIGLFLKPMADDLGWTRSTLAASAGIFLAVSATCMFISGKLADRFSLKAVLCGGLVVAALGIGAMRYVTAPWQALLSYGVIFAIGNGIASIAPVGVMISRRFPGRTGFANAITTSGIGIGQLFIIGALTAALAAIGWRSGFMWLGLVNLALIPIVMLAMSKSEEPASSAPSTEAPSGLTVREAARGRQFWLLIFVYAVCGFQDFFVATHVVAFAQDKGVGTLLAGNMLAAMGLAGVIGVLLAGLWSDSQGPKQATLFCFVLRIGLFALILFDQSTLSVTLFALIFGTTFWLTAPLTVIFARNAFGAVHLGALSGLIVMVHHMCGGLGAYFGAVLFDAQGHYDTAFLIMLVLSAAAALLTLPLKK